jgi:hypothetical protein
LEDRHSARRGTYRVIYRINDEQQVITVVDVAQPGGRSQARMRRQLAQTDPQRRGRTPLGRHQTSPR